MKDLYYILGQDINATPSDLNAAYRKLAQKLRPDGHERDPFLESHFSEIVEAYQVLSDPDKRRKYDAVLKKSHKRRLYWFRLSYLSVAAVFTLIGFTALFGYYVIRMISGGKTKAVAPLKIETIALIPTKHHKKKHQAISAVAAVHSVTDKPAVGKKALAIKRDTAFTRMVKPIVAASHVAKQPVISNTIASGNTTSANAAFKSYLQANTTGLVSLHQLASYQSAIITYIPNHSEVQVLEKGPSFCKVMFHDQTGYVPKWTVPE